MAPAGMLATYLNDHLAGAMAGRDLAEKLSSDNRDSPLGTFAHGLLVAIDEDRVTLENLMLRLGVESSAVKQATGRVVEKLGRVRLHQRVTGDPALSRLMELEALSMGVTGKIALWRTLRELAVTEARLADAGIDDLIERAQAQIRDIERHHREVAAQTFAG